MFQTKTSSSLKIQRILVGKYFYGIRKFNRKETITQAAKNMQMAARTLSMIEKGTYKPFTFDRFVTVCNYYHVIFPDALQELGGRDGLIHLFPDKKSVEIIKQL